MLECSHLSCGYGKTKVLSDIQLQFSPGRVIALIGRNGCGKSTLMKTLAAQLPPLDGKIALDGSDFALLQPRARARLISYLPQSRVTPDITALRLVLHGRFPYLEYPRKYSEKDFQIAKDALKKMGMQDAENMELAKLSGGQKQKVYLAMLITQDTPYMLLDEPTVSLDIDCQMDIWHMAKRFAAQGKTVLCVTHELSNALNYADDLCALADGKCIFLGSVEKALQEGIPERMFSVSIHQTDGTYYITENKIRKDI